MRWLAIERNKQRKEMGINMASHYKWLHTTMMVALHHPKDIKKISSFSLFN